PHPPLELSEPPGEEQNDDHHDGPDQGLDHRGGGVGPAGVVGVLSVDGAHTACAPAKAVRPPRVRISSVRTLTVSSATRMTRGTAKSTVATMARNRLNVMPPWYPSTI